MRMKIQINTTGSFVISRKIIRKPVKTSENCVEQKKKTFIFKLDSKIFCSSGKEIIQIRRREYVRVSTALVVSI